MGVERGGWVGGASTPDGGWGEGGAGGEGQDREDTSRYRLEWFTLPGTETTANGTSIS